MAIKPERFTTSITVKLIFILVVFLGVPVLIYSRFAENDNQRRLLLIDNLRLQGELAANTLRQEIVNAGENAASEAQALMNRVNRGNIRIHLLFRPNGGAEPILAASAPAVNGETAARLASALLAQPEIAAISANCGGQIENMVPISATGLNDELILSTSTTITPLGCWMVAISVAANDRELTNLVKPFFNTAEVQFAIVIYLIMAVIAAWAGISIWDSLRRFANLAVQLTKKGEGETTKFVEVTPVTELLPTAAAIDRLVETMRRAAEAIQEASEENAHALKGAVATVRQAIEPLHSGSPEARREALEVIERSLAKLDGLIAAAQRSEQGLATSITEGQRLIDLGDLVRNSVRAMTEQSIGADAAHLACEADSNIRVLGSEEALETIVENVLDNALGYAPARSTILVSVTRHGDRARLSVEDHGPGVPAEILSSIFDRHFSTRLSTRSESGQQHYGLGLAIVRRNVALLGGSVWAENIAPSGLRVTVNLPLASRSP